MTKFVEKFVNLEKCPKNVVGGLNESKFQKNHVFCSLIQFFIKIQIKLALFNMILAIVVGKTCRVTL